MNDEQTYALTLRGIQELGNSGAEVCAAAGTLGAAVFNTVDNGVSGVFSLIDKAGQRRQEVRLQKLQNKLKEMENAHATKMQRMHDAHEFEMLKEQNRHEEFVIREQRKVIEKMIEVASAAYDRKLDFINAQLSCLETTYSKERDLLSEHIHFLESERTKNMNDANAYALLSSDIARLEDSKSKLYSEYMTAQGNLNDAVRLLEVDKQFSNSLENVQYKLLEK